MIDLKKILPIFLLLLLTGGLIYESLFDTATYDEPANMAASFDYVVRNDYRLYPDNPPFIKLLAGLTLLPIKNQINFPQNHPSYKNPSQFNLYAFGTEFLYKSGNDAKKIIFLTRLPNILFTLCIGVLLYLFANKLFGYPAGLAALTFYSFDPNVRGHGHILAFDIPLAFWILLSLYLVYLFYQNKEKKFIYGLLLSVTFAFGFLTKFTFIFFAVPLFLGMYLLVLKNKSLSIKTVLLLQLAIIIFSFLLVWIFGLTTGYNSRSLNYDQIPLIASANKELGNNFLWNLFKKLPVPYFYKAGMQMMYTHNIVSQPAYFLGEIRARNDWFFYFPISFLLKTPIPTLILILLTLIILIKKFLHLNLKTYAPFVLGAFYFLCLMLFSHINNVYRYLFPSLILFILGTSQIVNLASKKYLTVIIILLSYLFLTSYFSFPYDLSYTNELTGIPTAGYKYLSDSEIDWGQDLERLAKWLRGNNLNNQTITLSYLGTADPEYYGIKYQRLRFDDLSTLKGIVVISVGNLTLGDWQVKTSEGYKLGFIKTAPLDILRNRQPTAVIGKSIFVYNF
jgi:4-amino-4-deoxy-L-arabinose transferase-like glycosyltransferase